MQASSISALLFTLGIFLSLTSSISADTISQPPASLPVQSYSDDPLVTSNSAALCSLLSILGTESAGHGIGPLTVQPGCMSATLRPHTSATINGQTLPSSGIATIFSTASSNSGSSLSSAQPTTAPVLSSSSVSSRASGTSSTAAPGQTNAGSQSRPPAVAGWVAKHNIAVVLFSTFALLAGVTYFLDELLGMLV